VLVVIETDEEPGKKVKQFHFMRWGLIPPWMTKEEAGSRWINARAETAAEKPLFRHAFKVRQCLIVADGFFEWQSVGQKKQPYYIHKKNNKPFVMAGLWERSEQEGQMFESCSILTTEANDLVKPIYHRMPVILPHPDFSAWLNTEEKDINFLQALLRPYEGNDLEQYPVSMYVNNPRHESKETIKVI